MSLKIDPSNAYAWKNKALIMFKLKCYDDALVNYEKALDVDRNFDAKNGEALVLKKLGY
jgi:tetratricopeptide (TPR) repeat protein